MSGLSCCIIGNGKLTSVCAQAWLDAGHEVVGVVSGFPEVLNWAKRRGVPVVSEFQRAEVFLQGREFDFLFSIINSYKISDAVLAMPKRLAINYHDGPLPRYAGLHVTSWAIQNRETRFGITWHKMVGEFDAGPILKQVEFDVEPYETAFSLSAKCSQTGAVAFKELVQELESGTATTRSQDLSKRSVYLSTKRPDTCAFIDWQRSAVDIEAQFRGLSFFPDPNPLGLPKFYFNNQIFIPTDLNIVACEHNQSPGRILEVSSSGILVAAGSSAIRVTGAASIDGQPVDLSDRIKLGDVIAKPSDTLARRISELDGKYSRFEKTWQRRLIQCEPTTLASSEEAVLDPGGRCAAAIDILPQSIAEIQKVLPHLTARSVASALFACFLQKCSDTSALSLGFSSENFLEGNEFYSKLFSQIRPLNLEIDCQLSIRQILELLVASIEQHQKNETFVRDLVPRTPGLAPVHFPVQINWVNGSSESVVGLGNEVVFSVNQSTGSARLSYAPGRLAEMKGEAFLQRFNRFVSTAARLLDDSLASVSILDSAESEKILVDWNQTDRDYDKSICIHDAIADQIKARPDSTALVFRNRELTYRELDEFSDKVASRLQDLGVGPDSMVGVFIERSLEMLPVLLGILKAGAAYVPLDPEYPRDRTGLMIEDAGMPVIITNNRLVNEVPANNSVVLNLEDVEFKRTSEKRTPKPSGVTPENLAYVIYTSGSTGKPKGVMIEHRNVINFFAGMDDVLGYDGNPGVWLAVTSISFDISVLELFWTLARGFKVIVQEDDARTFKGEETKVKVSSRPMDVSLFYFSSDAVPTEGKDAYRLLLEGARFADANGFSCVWTPERHFHPFGGLYPSPSVMSAALAVLTKNVAIRAGSIVLPLHNPIRVAEEWSIVDNLSRGRVGFSFASGWHANDFILAPENYQNRKENMFSSIETIRKLWRGDTVTLPNGEGKPFEARIYPPPIQKQPPIWITTAGNIETFKMAGHGGFNILTNLLGQSIENLSEKLAAYREAWKDAGHEGEGIVSVMVHTFVGDDVEKVRNIVREPFSNYLKTSFDLVKIAPWAFPAFSQPSKSAAQDPTFDPDSFTEEDMDALMEHAFDRYFDTAGIFGTPESCLGIVEKLKAVGVTEVACLIDFGVDDGLVLENLPHLARLKELSNSAAGDEPGDYSVSAQVRRHGVTHFQCTPSMARILTTDPDTFDSLSKVSKVLLGGEALPLDLGRSLTDKFEGELINVYGPTETTIWSTATPVPKNPESLTIGRPIANTQIYILDSNKQPTPIGTPGELYIGGDGVVRGYLNRPQLTAEKFIQNPFVENPSARIYHTGDLARYRSDGNIEFIGRVDHQVKLRGYRIELGEIESAINGCPGVETSVVTVLQSDNGHDMLVAYVVPQTASAGSVKKGDEPVDHWRRIWNETYQTTAPVDRQIEAEGAGGMVVDPQFNITGWLNSYTGNLHPESEMREWVESTVERILSLRPRRVLEIGCGTGLLLYRIAPKCESYVGVDFSGSALGMIENQLAALNVENVTLIRGNANEIQLDHLPPFDLVIINSVAQYFPSADYLTNVLKKVVNLSVPDGRIFVGDVRNLRLLEPFHSSVEITRATQSQTAGDVGNRVATRVENDAELVIDPDYFHALRKQWPQIGSVVVELKRGHHRNEMSVFRYDVFIGLGDSVQTLPQDVFKPFDMPADLAALRKWLSGNPGNWVARDVLEPRVHSVLEAHSKLKTVGVNESAATLRDILQTQTNPVIEPEEIYSAALPARCHLTPAASGRLGKYDAYFISGSGDAFPESAPLKESADLSEFFHQPPLQKQGGELTAAIQNEIRNRLPGFMVPETFVLLEKLPLTPNGKIDRKALPKPEKRQRLAEESFVAPKNENERLIASVWEEILNLEQVGVRDNFFDLGANSLLMVQANNLLRKKLSRDVSLVSMFRFPSVASLAEHLSVNSDDAANHEKSEQRGQKRRALLTKRNRRQSSR